MKFLRLLGCFFGLCADLALSGAELPAYLRLTFPAWTPQPRAQVLASHGVPGEGGVVFFWARPGGLGQLGYERVGTGAGVALSEPFAWQPGQVLEIVFGGAGKLGLHGSELYLLVDGRNRFSWTLEPSAWKEPWFLGVNSVGGGQADGEVAGKETAFVEADTLLGRHRSTTVLLPAVASSSHQHSRQFWLRKPTQELLPVVQWRDQGGAAGLWVVAQEGFRLAMETRVGGTTERSRSVRAGPGTDFDLLLSLPGDRPAPQDRNALLARDFLRSYLVALLNGEVMFFAPAPAFEEGSLAWSGEETPALVIEPPSPEPLSDWEIWTRLQRAWRQSPGANEAMPGGYRLVMRAAPSPGQPSPVVSTGIIGRADVLIWETQATGQSRLGLDHWGVVPSWSEPFPTPQGPVEVVVKMGNLLDPSWHPLSPEDPRRVEVVVNGKVVWSVLTDLYATEPEQIWVGVNLPGASSCRPSLPVILEQVERLGRGVLTGASSPAATP